MNETRTENGTTKEIQPAASAAVETTENQGNVMINNYP